MKFYEKCTAKPYTFSVNDTTLKLDNPLCFRQHFFKSINRKFMTIDKEIRDEKLQFHINRKAIALSSGKNDMNILQVKKQTKKIEDQQDKQIKDVKK